MKIWWYRWYSHFLNMAPMNRSNEKCPPIWGTFPAMKLWATRPLYGCRHNHRSPWYWGLPGLPRWSFLVSDGWYQENCMVSSIIFGIKNLHWISGDVHFTHLEMCVFFCFWTPIPRSFFNGKTLQKHPAKSPGFQYISHETHLTKPNKTNQPPFTVDENKPKENAALSENLETKSRGKSSCVPLKQTYIPIIIHPYCPGSPRRG